MKWFTKLFSTKKTISQLPEWLAEQQKKQQLDQEQAFNTLREQFSTFLSSAKGALNNLAQAELKNQNIPEQAKHTIHGNREHLINITQRFIQQLDVPTTFGEVQDLKDQLSNYAQSSARATAILAQFFGDNIKELRRPFAEMEQQLNTIQQISEGADTFIRIQQILQQLQEIKQQRDDAEKELTQLQKKLEQLNTKLNKTREEKENFTTRPDYLKVKEDILAAAKKRQDAAEAITQLFAPLTVAIKKYAHTIQDEKLAKYGEEPLPALINDYALHILTHVDGLAGAITRDEFGLSPEKKERALTTLKELTKATLGELIHNYANAKKKETTIHHEIAQRQVMQEYEHFAIDLKQIAEQISETEQSIKELTVPEDDELKQQLVELLKEHKIILI